MYLLWRSTFVAVVECLLSLLLFLWSVPPLNTNQLRPCETNSLTFSVLLGSVLSKQKFGKGRDLVPSSCNSVNPKKHWWLKIYIPVNIHCLSLSVVLGKWNGKWKNAPNAFVPNFELERFLYSLVTWSNNMFWSNPTLLVSLTSFPTPTLDRCGTEWLFIHHTVHTLYIMYMRVVQYVDFNSPRISPCLLVRYQSRSS